MPLSPQVQLSPERLARLIWSNKTSNTKSSDVRERNGKFMMANARSVFSKKQAVVDVMESDKPVALVLTETWDSGSAEHTD